MHGMVFFSKKHSFPSSFALQPLTAKARWRICIGRKILPCRQVYWQFSNYYQPEKKNLIISLTYEWFSSKVVNDQPKFTIRHDEFINVVISCSSSISRVALYYYLFLYVRCCLFLTLIYRLLGRFYIKECDVPPQGK